MDITFGRRGIAVLLVGLLMLATVPGVAAAETRTGGTVIIEEGETVDGLEVFAGSVVIRGTVTGNMQGVAGSVTIADTGHVTGNVEVATGSLSVAGTVDGSIEGASGSVSIEESAVVGGDVRAGAGSVTIAGTVQGSVVAGTETLRLTSSAVIQGDVRYDTDTRFVQEDGATVNGQITAVDNLGGGGIGPLPFTGFASWLLTLYGALLMLIVGAVLLAGFPGFTAGVADRVAGSPLQSAGTGLLGVAGVLVLVVALGITIIGIPIALLALVVFALLVLASIALGEYAIGVWTLSMVDVENRWAGLVAGVVLVTVLGRLPFVGWVVDLAAFLLGFGGVLLGLYAVYAGRGGDVEDGESGQTPS